MSEQRQLTPSCRSISLLLPQLACFGELWGGWHAQNGRCLADDVTSPLLPPSPPCAAIDRHNRRQTTTDATARKSSLPDAASRRCCHSQSQRRHDVWLATASTLHGAPLCWRRRSTHVGNRWGFASDASALVVTPNNAGAPVPFFPYPPLNPSSFASFLSLLLTPFCTSPSLSSVHPSFLPSFLPSLLPSFLLSSSFPPFISLCLHFFLDSFLSCLFSSFFQPLLVLLVNLLSSTPIYGFINWLTEFLANFSFNEVVHQYVYSGRKHTCFLATGVVSGVIQAGRSADNEPPP